MEMAGWISAAGVAHILRVEVEVEAKASVQRAEEKAVAALETQAILAAGQAADQKTQEPSLATMPKKKEEVKKRERDSDRTIV